jgi:hypothetical protein
MLEFLAPRTVAAVLVLVAAGSPLFAQETKPVIYRVDLDLERVLDAASSPPRAEDRQALLDCIREQRGLYALLGHRSPEAYAQILLRDHAITRELKATREYFAKRDLSAEIHRAYARVTKALGTKPLHAPRFWVAHGWSKGTNAQSRALGSKKEGARVFLNLPALARGKHWEAALLHESVHVVQGAPRGASLLDRAVYEGVATHLARRLNPEISAADALFWPQESWLAAEAHRGEILAAFAKRRAERRESAIADFIYLGRALSEVAGAPDRCAYYVGTLAVQAWLAEDAKRGDRDLLAASSKDLWAALEAAEKKRRKRAKDERDEDQTQRRRSRSSSAGIGVPSRRCAVIAAASPGP